MSLLKELVKKGVLDKQKAEALEKEIKTSLKKEELVLLEKQIVSEDFLFQLKSEYLEVPLKTIDPKSVPLEVLELIPQETANNYKMVSLSRKNNVLDIGMVYPEDLDAQEALKFLARRGKFDYKVFLINFSTFAELLKQHQSLRKEVGKALEELEEEMKTKKAVGKSEIERLVEEAPIAKVVAVILRYAVEGKASDIHIEPTKDKLRIRFRLLGLLHSSIFLPKRVHQAVVARIKVLSNLKIDESRMPQDGSFSARVEGQSIDFRVATFPTTLGEKVAIRVLNPLIGLKKFEQLGLSERDRKTVEKMVQRPYGLILATGPTGSGKTTTLYTILQLLNKEGVNIVTLEDPVEYFIEGVNQSQIRPDIGYNFAKGLRHMLRQDPDIIMVGEVRDSETASLATHAALTGHIVLSTLHTSTALGVIPRLIDLGVQPFLIPSTLSLIIAQRLVRKLCDDCKKKIKPKKQIELLILKEIELFPKEIKKDINTRDIFVWESKACKNCNDQGFSGRIGLFEVLKMTDELGELVLKGFFEKQLKEEAEKQIMTTIRQDGILKVLQGITTIEEVLRVTQEE
ncbi:MAG: GspE/PulE family protein [Patescibacteria group bacterium]|nr:GspE/PulE family protein [Patescibacteria group bacterium]